MVLSKVRILVLFSAVAAVHSAAVADAVTLAPPEGVTTNVLSLITGNTAVEVAGPGAVKLNPSNMHTGGTTLSGGTLILTGDIPAGWPSPVGTGTFTVSGGTLRGTGSFGGNITGTGAFAVEAPDGWAWTGDNTFDEAVTLSDGALEIASGATTFSLQYFLGTQGGTGEDVSLAMSGGTVTMREKNLFLSPGSRTKSTFTMTGGAWNMNNHRIITGYQTTYATNVTDISGTAAVTNSEYCYVYAGAGNCWALNVHDGGLFATKGSLYAAGKGAVIDISASNGGEIRANKITSTSGSTTTASVTDGGVLGIATAIEAPDATVTRLSIDGGIVRNDSTASGGDNYFAFFQANSGGNNGPTVAIGPKGATFRGGGKTTKFAQIYKEMTADVGDGSTPKGVVFDGGNWAYYTAQSYAGPTVIKNGAALFLPNNGTIPSGSAVTIASDSRLHIGNTDKSISSLVLEDGAIIGTGSGAKSLSVTGNVTLPSRAKIGFYNATTPTSSAKNTDGSYAVLKVPASYADALRAVSWTCATATSGKSYTFSVTTSGDIATLSMTIATAPSDTFAVSGDTALGGTLNVSGDITIGSGATLAAAPIYGTADGGSITINNGGTLDASAGNIRPVNKSGNSFHLYLNDGGTLIVNQIHGDDNSTLSGEANATPMFHFNGGTIYPVAFEAVDGNRFLLNYQTAVVGAKGVTVDLNRWIRPDGYTTWTRCSIQGNFNHDSNCAGSDGGITVRGIKGEERSVVLFGSRFGGSDIDGGIHVEDGTTVAVHESALVGQTIELAPGSRFRPFNDATVNVENMTIGSNGASEAVRLDLPTSSVSAPGIAVSDTLSVLSPVEIAFTSGWNKETSVPSGVCTALVYQAASPALDTSLFRAPPGFSISSETVAINTGNYNGYTALVLTLAQDDLTIDGSAEKTIAADAAYGDIYVGDSGTTANKSLLVSGGTITAGTLHLAHKPVDGANSSEKHVATYVQSGGEVSVNTLYSMYRGSDSQVGRVSAEITLNGGTLAVSGDAQLGFNQTRSGYSTTVTVNNGAEMTVGGGMQLTHYGKTQSAPQGILVMNGGSLAVGKDIDLSCCTNKSNYQVDGGIFLHGGTLSARNIKQTVDYTPAQRLVFDGGTFAPNAAAAGRTLSGLTTAHVSTGGAIIDTSALPIGATNTIAQALLTDPALDGAADGGLVKKGAGTLALSGANTYTGPTKVEAGTLVAANADALSSYVEVADGAVLGLGASSVTVSSIAASGAVAGNLTVTDAIVLGDEGSILSVNGNLTLDNRTAIDFGHGSENDVQAGWTPIAAVSGEINVPKRIKARNAGANFTRADTWVIGGVLYAKPCVQGLMLIMR